MNEEKLGECEATGNTLSPSELPACAATTPAKIVGI